jgi:flagellin
VIKATADRASLQQEFTAKVGELTRIASTTTFGGRNLLDGSFHNQWRSRSALTPTRPFRSA